MDEVERFIDDLTRLFGDNLDKHELRASARRTLVAFVGRAAVRENGYAPNAEIHRILSEGRRRLQALSFEGEAYYLRVELLTELDKTIGELRPRI